VFYAHGNEVLSLMKSDWSKPRLALKSAAAVIANSRHTAGLVSMMGLPPDRIRVVHPGCDVDRFKRTFVNEETRARLTLGRPGARILLTVGNLVERKGHDMVIRALSRLRAGRPDVIYVIAGDGPHRAALEQLAVSMGVADRVIFLGRVPASDLPLLYSMADIFLMVSRERLENCDLEGFGIVFIEAAACGAPVIGGRSGGIEDAVLDNVTGLLVDPLSIEDVAESIDRLLSDKALADRLGEAAMRRAVREFNWSRHRREIRAILEEVNASQS
jgi:phosphatidylinositol alpha-1,6-mannosyltransferase